MGRRGEEGRGGEKGRKNRSIPKKTNTENV